MRCLLALDRIFVLLVANFVKYGKLLRDVGLIEDGQCQVRIVSVDSNDPLYNIKNGENILGFYSHYYQPSPLVLRGHGAGHYATAAGVSADLLRTLSLKLEV